MGYHGRPWEIKGICSKKALFYKKNARLLWVMESKQKENKEYCSLFVLGG